MAVELLKQFDGRLLTIQISGKLHAEDYEHFVPRIEEAIKKHGKIRLLVEMYDFHGWDAGALWEDLKFDVKHFRDIERLALIGENRWEKGMSLFCKPFTTAEVKYFDIESHRQAHEWIESGLPSAVG